jgi:hypothetical protein
MFWYDDWPSSITISFGCSQFKSNLKDFSSCRTKCCIRFKSVGWSRNGEGKTKVNYIERKAHNNRKVKNSLCLLIKFLIDLCIKST